MGLKERGVCSAGPWQRQWGRPFLLCCSLPCITSSHFLPLWQTYVNNRPLRGGHTVLKHGDSIRFGYGKVSLVSQARPNQPQRGLGLACKTRYLTYAAIPCNPSSHSSAVQKRSTCFEWRLQRFLLLLLLPPLRLTPPWWPRRPLSLRKSKCTTVPPYPLPPYPLPPSR